MTVGLKQTLGRLRIIRTSSGAHKLLAPFHGDLHFGENLNVGEALLICENTFSTFYCAFKSLQKENKEEVGLWSISLFGGIFLGFKQY